jgi:WD40 repeat protein
MIIGDNGTLTFWDYATGTPFQNMEDIPQPGSLEAEAGVFCSTFDQTGTRLITGGADKTIKVCQLFFSYRVHLYLSLTSGRYMPNNRNEPLLTLVLYL